MSEKTTTESAEKTDHGAQEDRVPRPSLHHIDLKTTRLQGMIDWYGMEAGTEPVFQYESGTWFSSDDSSIPFRDWPRRRSGAMRSDLPRRLVRFVRPFPGYHLIRCSLEGIGQGGPAIPQSCRTLY